MGDLPEDASVSSSPKNSEVTLTIGFLNEKVNDSYVTYRSKWVGNSFCGNSGLFTEELKLRHNKSDLMYLITRLIDVFFSGGSQNILPSY